MTEIECLKLLTDLYNEYPGFCVMPAFAKGFDDYQNGLCRCPYKHKSIDAQAWDSGAELAMRYFRAKAEIESPASFYCIHDGPEDDPDTGAPCYERGLPQCDHCRDEWAIRQEMAS